MDLHFFQHERWALIRQDVIANWNAHYNTSIAELEKMDNLQIFHLLLLLVKNEQFGFRNLLRFRGGKIARLICRLYRPSDTPIFWIGELGGGCVLYHPFSSVINADHVGKG